MELTNNNSEINKPGAVFHCRVQGDHGGYRKRMNLTPVTLICRSTGIRIMISHSIQLVKQLTRQKNYQPIYQSIKKDKKLPPTIHQLISQVALFDRGIVL